MVGKRSEMVKNGREWSVTVGKGRKRLETVGNGSETAEKWSETAGKWSETARNSWKRSVKWSGLIRKQMMKQIFLSNYLFKYEYKATTDNLK